VFGGMPPISAEDMVKRALLSHLDEHFGSIERRSAADPAPAAVNSRTDGPPGIAVAGDSVRGLALEAVPARACGRTAPRPG